MDNTKEINLSEIASALLRKIWLIVICAVVAGSLTFAYTANFVTPLYCSSVKIYVNNRQASSVSQITGVTAADLATSQRLVDTYIQILSSDTVLQEVANKVKENHPEIILSPARIRHMMSASPLGDTEVFQVFITNENPDHAAIIANAIADVAPEQIGYFVDGSSTKIVDHAKAAGSPSSPNKTQNTALGMVIGAAIAACFIVLQTLMDVRVKSEDDLAAISSAPVLGLIPDLATETKGGYEYQNYKSNDSADDTEKEESA